jgi:protein-disulfide isomerase
VSEQLLSETKPSAVEVGLNSAGFNEGQDQLLQALTSRRPWFAPVWFLLGVLVGVIGFAAYTALTAKPVTLDATAMRGAARDGTLDAIATLQAGGGQAAAPTAQPIDPSSFSMRDSNRQGDKAAKISIVEFSDFQCPFCERFHTTVEANLIKQYVDTGKATFVYKHIAILGQESVWAAQAAECAADQGKFWQFHDLLFDKQSGENQGAFTKDKLLGFAQEMKLDMTKFEPCLNQDQTVSRVQADSQEGQKAGVRGTPTFFINGKPLVGAQPIEAFQAAIESALTGAQ